VSWNIPAALYISIYSVLDIRVALLVSLMVVILIFLSTRLQVTDRYERPVNQFLSGMHHAAHSGGASELQGGNLPLAAMFKLILQITREGIDR